jgi:hypothetical protein
MTKYDEAYYDFVYRNTLLAESSKSTHFID